MYSLIAGCLQTYHKNGKAQSKITRIFACRTDDGMQIYCRMSATLAFFRRSGYNINRLQT